MSWPRFSLRFLLVLTAVLGGWFSLMGFLVYSTSQNSLSKVTWFIPLAAATPSIALAVAFVAYRFFGVGPEDRNHDSRDGIDP